MEISQDNLLRATQISQRVFGFKALYEHQKKILASVLDGNDCLAVIPTGGGKSLCYIVPGLLNAGVTLVISPLIALIREQVIKLGKLGIGCAALDSLQTDDEKRDVWQRIGQGEIRLLFVSPERLALASFRERLLRHTKIGLVAIDEAHCISHWGYHFRPDYRKIGTYLQDFGPIQKLALTATATKKVRSDIRATLQLREPNEVMSPITRDNLKIKVFQCGNSANQMSDLLNAVLSAKGAGIIYAPTRKRVEEVYQMLCDADIQAYKYHAGLTLHERAAAQNAFMEDKCRAIVATNAFGMGIDKHNIRFVFHAGMPSSLEQYVQEMGRAGRDSASAQCYLFYGGKDYYLQKFIIEKSFPEVTDLKAALKVTLMLLGKHPGCQEAWFTRQLHGFLKDKNHQDVAAFLQVFYKEGILLRENTQQEIRVHKGNDAEVILNSSDFFENYAQRKAEHFFKLVKMHEYVTSTFGRAKLLEQYFAG